jgi:hypothetical protein
VSYTWVGRQGQNVEGNVYKPAWSWLSRVIELLFNKHFMYADSG